MYKILLKTILLCCVVVSTNAQIRYTIESDYFQKYNGCHDCDGFGAGDSDFEICMRIQDGSTLGIANYDEECHKKNGEDCGWTYGTNESINSSDYHTCLSSFTWQWRGREDDGVGSDANTGWIDVTTNPTALPEGTYSSWYTVQACSSCDGTPCYRIRYRYKWDNLSSKTEAPNSCSSPINIGSVARNQTKYAYNYSNDCATASGSDPSCFTQSKNSTVWFRFSTPSATSMPSQYEISVLKDNGESDALSPEFSLLTGSCGAYSCVTSTGGDNTIDPLSGDAVARYDCLSPSTTYYIMVDGDDCITCNDRGDFDVKVQGFNYTQGPDYLSCSSSGAHVISNSLPFGTTSMNNQSNRCASRSSGEPNSSSGDETVWYRFTTGSTVGDNIEVFVDSEVDIDAEVGVYTICSGSCSYGNLTEVAFDPGNPISNNSNLNFVPYPNTTYYVQVLGDDNIEGDDVGDFDLDITMSGSTPPNDNLCGAYTWGGTLDPGETFSAPASHRSNENSTTEELCALNEQNWGDGEHTIWFKFTTGSLTGNLLVNATASGITQAASTYLYEEINAPSCTGSGFSSVTTNWMGTSYLQEVGARGVDVSTVELDCPKPNTVYYIQVNMSSVSVPGTGSFSTVEAIMSNIPANDRICGAYDIGTSAGVAAKVGTHTNDSQSGTTINATYCYDPIDDWNGVCNLNFADDNDYGVWYRLPAAANRKDAYVKGISGIAPANDDMDIKYALYNAPSAGQLAACDGSSMSLVGGSFYGALGWNGSPIGTCLSPNEDHLFTCLDPAQDYYLLVDASASLCGQGDFELDVYYPLEGGPQPCSAVPIPGVSTPGWTAGGKIDMAANFCGNSALDQPETPFPNDNVVWWSFVAPASESVEIIMESKGFNGSEDRIDPELWVFAENTPGSGSCTALNSTNIDQKDPDDVAGIGDPDIYTEILHVRCLTPGQTYFIATDGAGLNLPCDAYTANVGFFSLEVNDLNEPKRPNDLICAATPGHASFDANYHFTPTAQWRTVNREAELTKSNHDNYCFVIQNEPDATNWGGEWSTTGNAAGGWYSFYAPPSGKVEIELNNVSITSDQIDAQIAVYGIKSGYTCNDVLNAASINNPALSPLEFYGSSDDNYIGPLADEDLTVTCLEPFELYYIYVEGVNSNALTINDLHYGQFNLTIRSHPQDPPALNDEKCNPIYLGQPSNAIGSTSGMINTKASVFNRNQATISGAPTFGTNGVNLVNPTNNHGGLVTTPLGIETFVGCSPNPGCIDGMGSDYDRNDYPFQNFCATNSGDPVPTDWNGTFGGTDDAPNQSVWFMFKAPDDIDANGEEAVEITLNQNVVSLNPFKDGINLRGAVFESSDNTCNGTFYDIKSDYDGGNYDETFEVHCLEPNRFYWLMVDGTSFISAEDEEGYFGIEIRRINPQPRPNNDYICDAYDLGTSFFTGAAVTRTEDFNLCATTRISDSNVNSENVPSGFGIDHTVWYKFDSPIAPNPAPGSGGNYAVEIDVDGFGPLLFGFSDKLDPQIAVFESQDGSCNFGTSGLNQIEITSEYDVLPFVETAVAYCIKPATTYYVMVDGSGINKQGYFDITIDDHAPIAPATNDDLANAITLTMPASVGGGGQTTSATSHNYCTSIEAGEQDEFGIISDIDNTVWYKFTVPTTGIYANKHLDLKIDLNSDPGGANSDNIMLIGAVYELDGAVSHANLNYIDRGIDVDPTGLFSRDETINVECLKPGTTYYLQVDGYSGPLYILRQMGLGFFNVQLEVNELHNDDGNDDLCGAIVTPVNNTFGPTYNNICKTLQTDEIRPWTGINGDQTVWFKFQPPSSGNVTVTIESQASNNIDAQVAIYQSPIGVGSSTCPAITDLVLVDNNYNLGSVDLTVGCIDDNVWHYIQINHSQAGVYGEGEFKVRITDDGGTTIRPYNDNICDAYDFGDVTNATGATKELLGESNSCASLQTNEPNIAGNGCGCIQKSVWYKFTAPTSGRVKITLHDADGFLSGIDPELILYSAGVSGCPSATPTFGLGELESDYQVMVPIVTDGDEELIYECLIPGDEYYIQVDGTTVGGPQGTFDIRIEDEIPNYASSPERPFNDECINAITLTVNDYQCAVPIGPAPISSGDELQGTGTWVTGNYKKPTVSKKDLTGGACNTNDNCGDIWYKFTMPNDDCMLGSVVSIQGHSTRVGGVTGDNNDLKIIAYRSSTGSCGGTLTPINCDESDGSSVNNLFFHYEITGTPGETIYLQVFDKNFNDEDNDDNEDFEICVAKRFGTDDCANLNDVPFMEMAKDYCWNVEGASGESPASAYGETNSGTNPTENSAYFKFRMTDSPCDSLAISIWQPTPPNTFLADGSTNPDQKISLSVYREDNVLCDGTIDGALISKVYTAVSATAIYDNSIGFVTGVSNLDTNKVYVIQIDGEGQAETGFINNGFIRIDTLTRCGNYVANLHNDTSVTYYECRDGWRHYQNSDDEIIFSLHPNGNNFEGIAFTQYLPDPFTHFEQTRTTGKIEGEWVMRRLWDYQVTSGLINPSQPVSIRFYYRPEEKQKIIDEALAFAATYGLQYEPFEWFKSETGVDFDLALHVNPTRVLAGFSETGCLTLFDTIPNGPYIGYPGIQVCDVFNAVDDQISCNGVQYVEISGIPGFSGGSAATGASNAGGSPLPVELLSFVGWNDGDVNELEWVTATELNNEVFVVERSPDAINFVEIGSVPGNGTTSEEHQYNFTDETPIQGVNYYRLKQIDYDGTFEYSSTIVIEVDGGIAKTAIVKLHPNPANALINIQLQSKADATFTMTILDLTGRIVEVKEIEASAGLNAPFALEIQDYPQGVYMINLVDEQTGETLEAKFVKQ